jgi:hypothetical protein
VSELRTYLETLERQAPVAETDLKNLSALFPWLPEEYIECLRWSDGIEGYVHGRGYVRLCAARAALDFNGAYHIAEFLPTGFLFGTDAGAIGYLFDQRRPAHVLSVELAALDDEYLSDTAASFGTFVRQLGEEGPEPEGLTDHRPPTWLRGHVLHEKHPIVLGGPPHDPNNRVLVPAERHPELVVFFTQTLRAVRAQTLRAK